MPTVSVIMPMKADSLTVVDWAIHAVKSVISQTFQDWELIICNDRSEADLTKLRNFIYGSGDRRIRGCKPDGSGVVAARNTAASVANGKFLMPLDADDALPPKSLEIMLDAWSGDGIVYGDTMIFGRDFQRRYKSREYDFNDLLQGLIMPVGSLHRLCDWEKIGGWHPKMESGLEDWEYWIRMGENGICGHYVPQVTYHYRRRKAGRYLNMKSARGEYSRMYQTMRDLHIDVYNGRFPVGCCGRRRRSKSTPVISQPQSQPQPRTESAQPRAEPRPARKHPINRQHVPVVYTGRRKASFQVVGQATGDRYNVPGSGHLLTNLRTGKQLVDRGDASMLSKFNRGRDFEVRA